MDKDIVDFFEQDKEDSVIKGTGTNKYKIYYIYSALTNFKRAVFECKEVKYNSNTGRIKEMKFEQIKSATY